MRDLKDRALKNIRDVPVSLALLVRVVSQRLQMHLVLRSPDAPSPILAHAVELLLRTRARACLEADVDEVARPDERADERLAGNLLRLRIVAVAESLAASPREKRMDTILGVTNAVVRAKQSKAKGS